MKQIPPSEVRRGHLMEFTYRGEVTAVERRFDNFSLAVKGAHGLPFHVTGNDLITHAVSADWYEETRPVTRTAMADALLGIKDHVFKVVFTKADGSKRTLRGLLLSSETNQGYANVLDLDKGPDVFRKVDLRTIEELVYDGTKYVLKAR